MMFIVTAYSWDSGVEQTLIHSNLFQPNEYTGNKVKLIAFDSRAKEYPLAKVASLR